MPKLQNKMFDITVFANEKKLREKNRWLGQYRCNMSGSRTDGYCEILIYDRLKKSAELFLLYFSHDQVSRHFFFSHEEASFWLEKKTVRHITYQQAMILIGDAVRQTYKYCPQRVPSNLELSVHAERIWDKEYYNEMLEDVNWISSERDPKRFIRIYLNAIQNKDSALLYDMLALGKKRDITKNLYMYNWNHVLEEIKIFRHEIVYVDYGKSEQDSWKIYLVLWGERQDNTKLLIDLCMRLIFENGGLRLDLEHILGAIRISD